MEKTFVNLYKEGEAPFLHIFFISEIKIRLLMLKMECSVCFLLYVNVGLSGLIYVYDVQPCSLIDVLFVQAHLLVFLIDGFQHQEKRLEVGIVEFDHMD